MMVNPRAVHWCRQLHEGIEGLAAEVDADEAVMIAAIVIGEIEAQMPGALREVRMLGVGRPVFTVIDLADVPATSARGARA